jgi:hypothetical protein
MKLTIVVEGDSAADIVETLKANRSSLLKLSETALTVLDAHKTAAKTQEASNGIRVIASRE